jgi:hypothetical protein
MTTYSSVFWTVSRGMARIAMETFTFWMDDKSKSEWEVVEFPEE